MSVHNWLLYMIFVRAVESFNWLLVRVDHCLSDNMWVVCFEDSLFLNIGLGITCQ